MVSPLDGIRIIDLSTVVLGPYATQILGDLGADVIKVETPEGDVTRGFGPSRNPGMAPIHLTLNRNKRSLALNLKMPAARAALHRLVKTTDVFLHNMRPKAAASLGVGYEDLRPLKPDLIYCWASGFGSNGPYADTPAYDDIVQGACGIAALQGRVSDRPAYVASIPVDKTAGLSLVYAVLAALFHRQRTGEGQEVEVPMFETVTSWTMAEHQWGYVFDPPLGPTGYPRLLSRSRRPMQTADGWISISPYTDKHWQEFFRIAKRPDLAADPRFVTVHGRVANISMLYDLVGTVMPTETTAYWLVRLKAADIPHAKVNDIEDLFEDEHLNAVGFFQRDRHPTEGDIVNLRPPVRFSGTPSEIRRQAPRLGENTVELLQEAGLTEAEVAGLLADRAAVAP